MREEVGVNVTMIIASPLDARPLPSTGARCSPEPMPGNILGPPVSTLNGDRCWTILSGGT
jgi:hypothetical protein